MSEKNLGELILNHYDKYLGNYSGREIYKRDNNSPSIQLLKYENVFEDCMTYATFGFSNFKEAIGKSCEIVMITDDCYNECEEIFANALFYIINNKIKFGRGTFIEGIEKINQEFAIVHKKSALYFTETYSFPDNFSKITDSEKMYMAFFISQQECEYIKNNGADAFEDELERMEYDIFDINRKSI